jgi:hypothetical protein
MTRRSERKPMVRASLGRPVDRPTASHKNVSQRPSCLLRNTVIERKRIGDRFQAYGLPVSYWPISLHVTRLRAIVSQPSNLVWQAGHS